MSTSSFEEELEYLYDYARKGLLYFVPVWDSAETLAGKGAQDSQVRQIALELIGALIDRGVRVGGISQHEDHDIDPWDTDKETVLFRVAEEMKQTDDPLDFIDICGFRA